MLELVKAEVSAEALLGDKGRVLRKSGTEPLIRVMVEGEDSELVQSCASRIADKVRASFNL